MESFNNTIIVVLVVLLAWYVGQSIGRMHVRQEVKRSQNQLERPEQKVDQYSSEGGGDFIVLIFLMAAAGGVAALVLVR
jgi:hypothetical protein